MSHPDVEAEIRTIVGEVLGTNLKDVSLSVNLLRDLGLDSLSSTEILYQLEDKFRFTIDGLNPPPLLNLQDLVNLAQMHYRAGVAVD